ncbi:hypothetical protein N0V95_002841 [Ascochyta clinopodiicola]|nr:hypothetical protein N0V95_002841 [Ascochyta clinopodiicola]
MTNVYVLGVKYVNSTEISPNPLAQSLSVVLNDHKGSSQLEVRAGYFGMCVRQRGIIWICSRDTDSLAEQVGFDNDPLNLIGTVSRFRDGVLFSGLLLMSIGIAFISIVYLALFPDWHEKKADPDSGSVEQEFLSQATMNAVSSCCFASAGLTLVAALWQHVGSVGAAAMADSANYGNVKADVGSGATSMVWAAFTIVGASTVLIVFMTVYSKISDRQNGHS